MNFCLNPPQKHCIYTLPAETAAPTGEKTMIIKKAQNTALLADIIEKSSHPVYLILDDQKIDLTENRNLLNLFRKYWKLEDVTEVTLEVENMDFLLIKAHT
jgi:hypothetical protein